METAYIRTSNIKPATGLIEFQISADGYEITVDHRGIYIRENLGDYLDPVRWTKILDAAAQLQNLYNKVNGVKTDESQSNSN